MSSFNELFKFLLKNGCQIVRRGKGSCIMMVGPNGNTFPFHHHGAKEIKEATKKGILKQAGLTQG